jgi:metal-responsive CopG/Arc/MetJ family transcriptional regulator
MNECRKSRLLFDDAFFGELSNPNKLFLDRHLESCPRCRAELNQNSLLLSVATKKNDHEPPPGFWDNYTANLHQRMLSERVLKEKKRLEQPTHRFTLTSLPNWALKGAAAAILLMVGIFIGRQYFAPDTLPAPAPGPTHQNNEYLTANLTEQQNILLRTSRFLNRSRVILLAIENFDPETENARVINLPYQKKISRVLLKEAIELKQDLLETRQRHLKELISEVEIILLQIANIDSGSGIETLQLVGDGQYIRGMLFKIRIYDFRWSKFNTNSKKGRLKKWRKI